MRLMKSHPLIAAVVSVALGLAAAFALIYNFAGSEIRPRLYLHAAGAGCAVLAAGCLGAARLARKRQKERERAPRRWFNYLLFALFFLVLAICLIHLALRL